MPKLSVIIPVYGVEKYLREALDSVINQTLDDIEIILIDDGGKDNCPAIIDEYAKKDSRIVVIHKTNGGYGQACNTGLDRATGEYVAIMEPDDYIESHMYEDLYKIGKDNDSDIVKSPFYLNCEDHDYKKVQYQNFTKSYNITEIVFTIFEAPHFLFLHPSIWSAIYKKDFLKNNNIRFVEAPGSGWTDNPFQVQVFCLAKKINYTSKAYYYWRVLNGNPSEELRNYKVPFLRCAEIREWLKNNNFYVEEILSAYYVREINYIKTTLGMENVSDEFDHIKRIEDMIEQTEMDIVANSKYIPIKDKKLYKNLKNSVKNVYKNRYLKFIFPEKLKRIKKHIIKLKISSKGLSLVIFNKKLI